MKLPAEERERLGKKLLSSVATPLAFEAEWVEEVDRRVEELETGAVEPIAGEDVFRDALNRLR